MSDFTMHYRATPFTLEDGGTEFVQCDENGNLKVAATITGGGDASAANQTTQIAAEEAIQVAVESIDAKIPSDPATDTAIANVVSAVDNVASIVATDGTMQSILTALGTPLQEGGNVSVTNFPATQPVSGPLTDAQLRATAVPVSGTVTITPSGTQNIAAASQAATAFIPVRVSYDGSNFISSGTVSTGLSLPTAVPYGGAYMFAKQTGASTGHSVICSSVGALLIAGQSAVNSTASAVNPVLVAGVTGATTVNLLCDASGRQIVVGAAASGAAVTGNPVLMAGSDGTNARTISTNSSGQVAVNVQNFPSDPATASNQSTANTKLTSIASNTLIGTGWFPSQSKKYTSVGSGIDLTTAVPGKTCIALEGAIGCVTGVMRIEFVGNASGELYERNFGAGSVVYGQIKKIDATTTNCFPLYAFFV